MSVHGFSRIEASLMMLDKAALDLGLITVAAGTSQSSCGHLTRRMSPATSFRGPLSELMLSEHYRPFGSI